MKNTKSINFFIAGYDFSLQIFLKRVTIPTIYPKGKKKIFPAINIGVRTIIFGVKANLTSKEFILVSLSISLYK